MHHQLVEGITVAIQRTSNSTSKTRVAAAPRTRITWAYFVGSEEPLLKLLRSAELQRTNSSLISNCRRRSQSAIFFRPLRIIYNIKSLLRLRVGTHIIYNDIIIITYIHTGSRNETNIRTSDNRSTQIPNILFSFNVEVLIGQCVPLFNHSYYCRCNLYYHAYYIYIIYIIFSVIILSVISLCTPI